MGVDLYVGGHAGTIQKERETMAGKRMFSAAHRPQLAAFDANQVDGYIDSGAFTDKPRERLTPEQALNRQLNWEIKATEKWSVYGKVSGDWMAKGIVSYDLLIDEVWTNEKRHKQRWSIKEADQAVRETVIAAQYLVSQRERLAPRKLILSCQGVDAIQYRECMQEILSIASPNDVIGFGGWCILGRFKSWIPEFWRTLRATLPLIATNGNTNIHIFGVLYQPALGGLVWLADRYGLSVSTDSTAPIKSAICTTPEKRKKAGCRVASGYWLDNVNWWINSLKHIRGSEYYQEPPDLEMVRQLSFFE